MESFIVSPEEFIEVSKTLKGRSAPGPDGVPALLIKNTIDCLSIPLAIMWNESLKSGKVPTMLKRGTVVPIF